MKIGLLCLPCTVRAAYDIATKSTEDEELQERIITESIKWLMELKNIREMNPTILGTQVCRIARRLTGNPDPFHHLKALSNRVAMEVAPALKREIEAASSPEEAFRLAVMGAICGNTIDFEVEGYKPSLEDLKKTLRVCLRGSLHVDDTKTLMGRLSTSRRTLYLLDNAGEIAFDKLLIEVITENYPTKIWAVVKEAPVLNDATMEDAEEVGLNRIVDVVTTGSDHVGLNLEEASDEFKQLLKGADLIIAKGQGYYESLTEVENLIQAPICYILRAKCKLVAESLGVPVQTNIAKLKI